MSEILQSESHRKPGVRTNKKHSIRVDLTPMVDLGFLLISFFVFTTSIAHPTAMNLVVPDDKDGIDGLKAPVSKTLNLLLAANNTVYAYSGDSINDLQNLGSIADKLRSAIIKKKQEIKDRYGSDSGMIVLIKPTPDASYKNLVNSLDEMQICTIKTYVLMDANKTEMQRIKER